jgi:hypothetical protein
MKVTFKVLVLAGVLNGALMMKLSARIGDDPKVCSSKYGVAIEDSPDGRFLKFEKDGIRVTCLFADGVCSAINYSLIPTGYVIREELGKAPRFTKEQAALILNLNRGEATWSQESKDGFGEKEDGFYKTSDGKLHAEVSSVGVSIELIKFHQAKLAKVESQAVAKTLASFESGPADVQNPVIRYLPDVPKQPDPLEESMKELEKSNKELQENMRIQNLAAAEAMASLDLVAKRVQKRQEMRDMLARFKNLEAELAVAKSPEILKALQLQEAALTEEMNRAAKEYEALDSEFNESKKPDTSPAGK